MRRLAAVMGVLFLLLAVRAVATPSNGIKVSGQNDMAIIDTNGDGIPDSQDCHFMGMTSVSGNLLITTTQDSHPSGGTKLRVCSGDFMGSFDNPSTFLTDTSVSGKINMSTISGGITSPLSFDGMFSSQGGGAGGGAAATGARTITVVNLTQPDPNDPTKEIPVGSGLICDSVAKVILANGLPMAVGLLMDVPGYLHVQGLPFQTLGQPPTYVFKDVFIPKINGIVTFSLASAPNDILVQILLSGTCGRVPALSELNLILLALAMLVGGAWLLGYRRTISEALPLP